MGLAKNFASAFARMEKQEKTVLDQDLKRKNAMLRNARSGLNGWRGQNVPALVELALKNESDVAVAGARKSAGQIRTRRFRVTRKSARNGQAGKSGMIAVSAVAAEIVIERGFVSTALTALD